MKTLSISVAYMPLVDALPLIAAQELGFAEAEGIALDLVAAPSWSSVRDMLSFGRVDAAHLLSPMPVAMALGLGSVTTPLAAVSVLSANGNMIGVSRTVEQRLRDQGYGFDFGDARAAAQALAKATEGTLTIGVPFPFSMHVELLNYWLDSTGLSDPGIEIRTVPPPLMAQALRDGSIDAFCVGEPWGSVAVEQEVGALLLPGKAIWSFAPEKVLAVRSGWAETEPELLMRMMRAVWRAARWAARPESRTAAAEMLSRPGYLDVPAELIDRALTGQFIISGRGDQRNTDGHVDFFDGAANFPWRSQAKWIGSRLAHRFGLDQRQAQATAAGVFRSDLFRAALQNTGADLPGASQKLEGAIRHPTAVASLKGGLILKPDTFFDGQVFEPLDEK
ncbi:ABC transporter substrate-binding protein [Phaeobacter sp. QD34_3]|uniref:ABC transporter substrate-binding protein n=1 Tax=unclassified Phaeobacter TaxID=2621772 RepID=UPI00237F3546|nr:MULTISPECIES: ABC transporter substrate-binding protein [unclassified Phaeobacter]MDE4133882.1 ABC transporter substrate-binding protein [Phaeobacter sp. QD34_3]MDE4137427.1 ABC transporter substrate-binding protein [Phaeobacter sp. QD34_24]